MNFQQQTSGRTRTSLSSDSTVVSSIVAVQGIGGSVNLNEEARSKYVSFGDKSKLLIPSVCEQFVRDIHARTKIAWSYGGYLESRAFMWRGSYLDAVPDAIHLGVDINVPRGTVVKAPVAGTVIRIDNDGDQDGGWGPRIFLGLKENPEIVLLFAHLGEVSVKEGDDMTANSPIAVVGSPPDNGNWFPHLHIQAVKRDVYDLALDTVDGYCASDKRSEWEVKCPNPLSVIAACWSGSPEVAL